MAQKAKKILIAEDEKPMARALELKLKNEGFDMTVAYNGKEAIEKIDKEKFDLVICDLIMPQVDGFGVLKHIKDKKINTKIVVASNLSQEDDRKKAKELGAIDFLVKSDTPIAKIVEKVKGYLK